MLKREPCWFQAHTWATYIRKYTGSVYCTDLLPNTTPTLLNVYVSSKASQNCVAQAKPRYTLPEQSKTPKYA